MLNEIEQTLDFYSIDYYLIFHRLLLIRCFVCFPHNYGCVFSQNILACKRMGYGLNEERLDPAGARSYLGNYQKSTHYFEKLVTVGTDLLDR